MNVILNFFYQFFEMKDRIKAFLETVSEHLNLNLNNISLVAPTEPFCWVLS